MKKPDISVIIPSLNEEACLGRTLDCVRHEGVELIVSDGGSTDRTKAIAEAGADIFLSGARGRGPQMNAGAAAASGSILVFLHADTLLEEGWREEVLRITAGGAGIGAMRFGLPDRGLIPRTIEMLVNLRSRLISLPYGDQALFMRRSIFEESGGFREIPIMEDVDLVRRLSKKGGLVIARCCAITSSRRWRKEGWLWTGLRNQALLYLYLLGVQPENLYRFYRAVR